MKILKLACLFLSVCFFACSKQNTETPNIDKEFLEERINIPSTTFRTVNLSSAIGQTRESPLCSDHEISFEELANNQASFDQFLQDLGISLNNVCPCPKGDGYCPWEATMFKQFIYNTEVWDLTGIEIYVINENDELELVSENFEPVPSPSGNFAFIKMSNPLELNELPIGSEMHVIYRWNNSNNEEECAVLKNIIPG